MKLHPRHQQTTKAKLAIGAVVIAAVEESQLTYAELVGILAEIITSWTRLQIRDERAEEPTETPNAP